MIQKTLFGVVLSITMLATAAGAAEEGQGNLFAGDIGNVVWTLAIFVLVIVVLGKFAWGPLLSALQHREEFIRRSLKEAKDDREAAEKRLQEYEEKLSKGKAEAAEIVDEGRRESEKTRLRIEEQAREESDKMIERAKREIDLAKRTAIKDLYATSADLATEIASKILQRELSAKDHERLIDESIAELGDLDKN